ncbi:MAG TPA: monofunctional biosynthetic peptidoglycan transglycosylase [Thermoanaerobaculia bacterium]
MKKLFILFGLALGGWIAWEWLTFPDVSKLRVEHPETTAFMKIRKEKLRREGKSDALDCRWVSYDRVSPYLRRAVLVSEDSAFYEHKGVDVEGMKEALRRDWKERRFAAGGSTVTQQLAKNLYLSPSKNPIRKVKELILTRALERELSKKRILELYLNVVEFGERVYGAEAAARHYFGKSASALTPRQAALLAGCLPNPRTMNPASPNRRLRARQRIILSRMRRWGSVAEKQMLAEKKPALAAPPVSTTPEPIEEEPATDTSVPIDEEPPATETAEPTPTETTATDTIATDTTTTTAPPP